MQMLNANMTYYGLMFVPGVGDPPPPSGLAGGDLGDRLQDDLRGRGFQPQAAPAGGAGGPGLPQAPLQHRPVDMMTSRRVDHQLSLV